MNENVNMAEKVRVVSISTGTFQQQENFEQWKDTLQKAEQKGILVVTCAQDELQYGILARIPGTDPDKPENYKNVIVDLRPGIFLVPTSNRTTASHIGPDIYTYWRQGGASWAAPYLAGLAALAFQVNPEIEPKEIVDLWIKTASQTDVGQIVNPVGFIEAVRELK